MQGSDKVDILQGPFYCRFRSRATGWHGVSSNPGQVIVDGGDVYTAG